MVTELKFNKLYLVICKMLGVIVFKWAKIQKFNFVWSNSVICVLNSIFRVSAFVSLASVQMFLICFLNKMLKRIQIQFNGIVWNVRNMMLNYLRNYALQLNELPLYHDQEAVIMSFYWLRSFLNALYEFYTNHDEAEALKLKKNQIS